MSSAFKTIDYINEPTTSSILGTHLHQSNLSINISTNGASSYFESDFFQLNSSSSNLSNNNININNSTSSLLNRGDECESPKKKKFRQSDSPYLFPVLLPIIESNNNISNSCNNILNSDDENNLCNIKLTNSVNTPIQSNNSMLKISTSSFSCSSSQTPLPNFLLSCFDYADQQQQQQKTNSIDENDSQVNFHYQNDCDSNSNHSNGFDEQSSETTTITPHESNTPLSSSNDIINDEKFVNNNKNNQKQLQQQQFEKSNSELYHVDDNQMDISKPSFIYSVDNQNNLNCTNSSPELSSSSSSIVLNKELIYSTSQSNDSDSFDNESLEGVEAEEEEEEEETWNPLFFIKQLPSGVIESIAPLPKLPPKDQSAPKITLVLDLDETLVHCSTEPLDEPHLTFPVTFNNIEYQVFAKKRPFFEEFLLKMSNYFELIIFTASQEIYARTLLDIIDPENRITHRLYRDSCVFLKGNYLKDLRVLNRDLNHVIIVDNSPQSFGFHVDNGIPIESWFEDETDKELLALVPFLESLIGVDDVRPFIREKYWKEFNFSRK